MSKEGKHRKHKQIGKAKTDHRARGTETFKIVKPDRRQSLRDITHEFNASNVQSCSTRTIQRFLPSLGYNRDPCVKQLLSVKSTEKGQNDKQRSRKHTHKTKDGFTRTPPKTGDELR